MVKKGAVYIVIAALTLGLLLLLEYNRPKVVNWYPSYVSTHKIPYGTYVLNDIMQQLFEKLQQVDAPPFAFLTEATHPQGTYFFVNGQVEFGEAELKTMLDWVSKGNTLFMASNSFEGALLDTLGLETGNLYPDLDAKRRFRHRLVHPKMDFQDGAVFQRDDHVTYFKTIDTAKTVVIGSVAPILENSDMEARLFNVVKQPFGRGEILLSTFPKTFTNFFILKEDNREYTAGLLSYLDGSRNIYIDNFYKSGKPVHTSPMYLFLNTKELKWAYYLVLIGAVIYVIFEGKRKQRAIPVVQPLKNQTLAFTRTIADMYYEKGEAKPIVEQQILNFLEYIRTRFHLSTNQWDAEFYRNLASRSGHSPDEIERLFAFLRQLKDQEVISDNELRELNTSLEKFKKRAKTA
ncbi:DUF4350 domain-containing protein [Pricia sp. S334]|uniref:DUF4350 domain-containing protein n=1 Tax=Pricia mediterranea TaxID=3076079 RepID=A0ABU3L8I2_9FLAO|nr:DUF4350 domain-containing protein [Pricia sp. S334]MDT7829995.1 DUF4350 domain-containing protein [Pricia sp. S334]